MSVAKYVQSVVLLCLLRFVACGDRTTDDYVVSAQSECFASKRIVSCFRYKAARYLWSMANGKMNLFEHDNSRSIVSDAETSTAASGFHFVQLTEPSHEILFPAARQLPGNLIIYFF